MDVAGFCLTHVRSRRRIGKWLPAPAVSLGATDIRIDPQTPSTIYASFWSDKIYKSTDGGATWNPAMGGLPAGNFARGLTRFNLAVSHPATTAHATLYTGFDYFDTAGNYHKSQVYKSSDVSPGKVTNGSMSIELVSQCCVYG